MDETVNMVPLGYMAKRVEKAPFKWIKNPVVQYIAVLSGCISEDFMDYIEEWRHNGYWLFDNPDIIRGIMAEKNISNEGLVFFYYEATELEYDLDDDAWQQWSPEPSFHTDVLIPDDKILIGYDVVTYSMGNGPECSVLSCNGMADDCLVNSFCLFQDFQKARVAVESGVFKDAEPGPCRIVAVYLSPSEQAEKFDLVDSQV